ncbi:hypothetical protein EC988_005407, partial [Linderina pennispora]
KKGKKKHSKAGDANNSKESNKMLASVMDNNALLSTVNPDCSPRNFRMLQYLNYLHSLIDPGESVGLIAAQGIGEPSTQMTLNTFHLAGFGAKNVTLGIPRLREIVMVATDRPSAPNMKIHMADGVTKEQAKVIAGALSKLTLSDVIDYVEVKERLSAKKESHDHRRYRQYTIRLQMFPSNEYEEEHDVSRGDIEHALEFHFANKLEALIAKDLKRTYRTALSDEVIDKSDDLDAPSRKTKAADEEEAEEDNDAVDESDIESDEDDEAGDGDADDARAAARRSEQKSYDGPDDEDKKMLEDMDAELDELDSDAKRKTSSSKNDASDSESESESEDDEEEIQRIMAMSLAKRRKRMVKRYPHVVGYNFVDEGTETYAEIEMQFPATTPKFLMLSLTEDAVRATVVREITGISECYIDEPESEKDTTLRIGSSGSNIRGIWEASLLPLDEIAATDKPTGIDEWVNLKHLYTNDIAAILRTYGVEAARSSIMREIAQVFGTYDITVDKRHLSLVADYMTFEGGFKPFNRIGLSSSPSPFAKMSFESTCTFLQEATVFGDFDQLTNPSARIVMGQPVASGTGSFDVMLDLVPPTRA